MAASGVSVDSVAVAMSQFSSSSYDAAATNANANGSANANDSSSRVQSPRPETPEPYVAQGRRNAPVGVQLLDAEGVISEKVSKALRLCASSRSDVD